MSLIESTTEALSAVTARHLDYGNYNGATNLNTGMVKADANGELANATLGTDFTKGTGTTNRIPKFTATGTIGDSSVSDDGTTVSTAEKLSVTNTTAATSPAAAAIVSAGGVGAQSLAVNSLASASLVKGTVTTGVLQPATLGTDYANGTGTTNRLSKFTGPGTIGDSAVSDVAGAVTVGVTGGEVTHRILGNGSVPQLKIGVDGTYQYLFITSIDSGTTIESQLGPLVIKNAGINNDVYIKVDDGGVEKTAIQIDASENAAISLINLASGGIVRAAPTTGLLSIATPGEYYLSYYGTCAAAIAAIGSTVCDLVIDISESLSADTTFPATMNIKWQNSAVLTIATGKTLTINRMDPSAPLRQLFAGAGSVSIPYSRPEFFGSAGDGVTDDTAALSKAATSSSAVMFSRKDYYCGSFTSATSTMALASLSDVTLISDGARFIANTTGAGFEASIFKLTSCINIHFKGEFVFKDNTNAYYPSGVNTIGFDCIQIGASCSDIVIDSVHATNCLGAVIILGTHGTTSRITIGSLAIIGCMYGLNCRENGDDVSCNIKAYRSNRGYFGYGVQNHRVDIDETERSSSFSNVIKRYGYDTTNITVNINAKTTYALASQPIIQIDHQNDDVTTSRITGVTINYNVTVTDSLTPRSTGVVAASCYSAAGVLVTGASGYIYDDILLVGNRGVVFADDIQVNASSSTTPGRLFAPNNFVSSTSATYSVFNVNHVRLQKVGVGCTPSATYMQDISGDYGIRIRGSALSIDGATNAGMIQANANTATLAIVSGGNTATTKIEQYTCAGAAPALRETIDSNGVLVEQSVRAKQKVLAVDGSQRTVAGVTSRLYAEGLSNDNSSIAVVQDSNTTGAAQLLFGKSRGTSIGSNTAPSSGDDLGVIAWAVADGTDMASVGARIQASADGTIGSNDTPARIEFWTTPAGSDSPVRRAYIDNAGLVKISSTTDATAADTGSIQTKGGLYVAKRTITGDDIAILADSKNLELGARSNMFINYDGTNGNIDTDLVAPSDLTIDCGTDKTLVLEVPVYDDLNFDPTRSGGPAATRPDDVTINNVIHKEFTSANNQLCGAVEELPHKYKLSGTLYPHAHFFLKGGESAGTTGVTFTFYWELRKNGATTSGSVALSATSTELTNNPDLLSKYDNTGFAGCSVNGGQLACTIKRTAGDAGDVVLTTYGVHYAIDTMGSRTISAK